MSWIVGGTCALFAVVAAIGFPLTGLRLDLRGAAGSAFAVVALLLLYLRYRRRDLPRLRDTAVLTFWGVLLSTLYILPMYVVARRALPFHDQALASIDAALHLQVRAKVASRVLDLAYDSLQFGCLLALMVPPLAGKPERTRALLLALVVASITTLATFALFRAIGPWEAYGFPPSEFQLGCSRACRALAGAQPYVVDLRHPDPVIAFPSWHVILAVLSALTLLRIRHLGWIAAPWGLLVVVSTVTTGWHYVIDSLAGVALAVASWTIGVALEHRTGTPR